MGAVTHGPLAESPIRSLMHGILTELGLDIPPSLVSLNKEYSAEPIVTKLGEVGFTNIK